MLEFKVSWYISDHTVAGHGMTLIVPGSHLWTVTILRKLLSFPLTLCLRAYNVLNTPG